MPLADVETVMDSQGVALQHAEQGEGQPVLDEVDVRVRDEQEIQAEAPRQQMILIRPGRNTN